MEHKNMKYPVGEQSFEMLRRRDLLYVDKTPFIEKLLNEGGKYFFLGRPRRFGKSLFLSAMKCFFEGKRELFRGLYADTMDWDWTEHPVLYLDLNIERYKNVDDLDVVVDNLLKQWELKYGIDDIALNNSVRFQNVIKAAYEKTGRGVIVLVDEYDKPLVNNLHDSESFVRQRDKLAALYSNFKSSADYIRMVFLTGVSRFAHLSIFSGLNNIKDLSFNDSYSDICGITEEELRQYFPVGINAIADKFGWSADETLAEIKRWYDGYRFSLRGKDMYNPFSLLNLMSDEEFSNYWIQSGQATLLLELLKKQDARLETVLNSECSLDTLRGLDLDNVNLRALLYQTGYVTIKDYDREFGTARLGLPNEEVTRGFLTYLLPAYARLGDNDAITYIQGFARDLRRGNAEEFMQRLQTFFADTNYELKIESENNFQNAFYILMKVVGVYVEAERRTSNGRIDLFFATKDYLYIVELKKDGTAAEALDQINRKDYALPFAADGRRVIKIGASFSSADRTVNDWIIA